MKITAQNPANLTESQKLLQKDCYNIMKQEKTKLIKLEQETLKKKKLQDMENTKEIINEKSDT